jgi:hypothetical protein
MWPHTDAPRTIGVRVDSKLIRIPSSSYVCKGCWLFRRQRITVRFISNEEPNYKDVQCPVNHSWLITDKNAWGIRRKEDAPVVYETLLDPPLRFCLSLITDKQRNHLQTASVNHCTEIKGDTPLCFTLDGTPYMYSAYELETLLNSGNPSGMMPGTKALVDFFGPYKLREDRVEKKKEAGRPKESPVVETPPSQKVLKEEAKPEPAKRDDRRRR